MDVLSFMSLCLSIWNGIGLGDLAEGQTITPSGNVTVTEGNRLQFNCTSSGSSIIVVLIDGITVTDPNFLEGVMIPDGIAFTLNPLAAEHNGRRIRCNFLNGVMGPSDDIILSVEFSPVVIPNVTGASIVEGMTFSSPLTITGNPSPTILNSDVVITKDGVTLKDQRFAVVIESGNATSGVTFQNLKRSDQGSYEIGITTSVGTGVVIVNLDIYYVPEYSVLPASMQCFVVSDSFVFNCTPSDGNPLPNTFVFQRDGIAITEGVNSSTLFVGPLSRSNTGNYTCTAGNVVGSVTIATFLNVIAVPSAPQDLEAILNGPFSVAITWDPPSVRGGTVQPLSYSIRVTNSTYDMIFNTLLTELTLNMSNGVWHSTMYSVTVAAENEAGSGSFVGSNFITPDSVPIIDSISVEVLPYSLVSLVVELLTTGGRNINKYEVKIIKATGHNSPIIDQEIFITLNDLVPFQYTIVDDQYYNITVIAINSVGSSDPISTVTPLEPASTGVTPLSDNIVGISVGGALGGFFLGVLITALCLLGVIICYRRQCCRNVICKEAKDQDAFYEVYELRNEMAQLPQPYEIPVGIKKPIANEQSASEQEEQQQGHSGEAVSKNDTLYI